MLDSVRMDFFIRVVSAVIFKVIYPKPTSDWENFVSCILINRKTEDEAAAVSIAKETKCSSKEVTSLITKWR